MNIPQPGPWILIPDAYIKADGTVAKDLTAIQVCHSEDDLKDWMKTAHGLFEGNHGYIPIPFAAALHAVELRDSLESCLQEMEQDQDSGVEEDLYEDEPREDIISIKSLIERAGGKL
jgi:hypothetical protein